MNTSEFIENNNDNRLHSNELSGTMIVLVSFFLPCCVKISPHASLSQRILFPSFRILRWALFYSNAALSANLL